MVTVGLFEGEKKVCLYQENGEKKFAVCSRCPWKQKQCVAFSSKEIRFVDLRKEGIPGLPFSVGAIR
jgi:hypothetical protein